MRSVAQLMNLAGRRALITGAAGELGRVMASTLAELGADLVLVDRPGADFGPLEHELRPYSVQRWLLDVDLEIEGQRSAMINAVREDNHGLSILINNAAFVGTSGLNGWSCLFEEQTIETWRRALELNLTVAFHLSQGFASLLRSGNGGNIINIASIHGFLGPDWRLYEGTQMANPAAYATSKGGLLQLTRWLATTLAPHVRVNAISPGGVRRTQPERFVARYLERTPLRRMATEDDFRGAVAFLASDLSSYVTGHNLVVDGGWSAW